jgi:hypothetical protein
MTGAGEATAAYAWSKHSGQAAGRLHVRQKDQLMNSWCNDGKRKLNQQLSRVKANKHGGAESKEALEKVEKVWRRLMATGVLEMVADSLDCQFACMGRTV